jgi:basic amino acid/polyamine antiporter, APA family
LLGSTALYIAVCLVATGLVDYRMYKGVDNPISYAVECIPGYRWLVILIKTGALAGLTSVILCSLLGQPRIFYSMAVDGLFPKVATKIHPEFGESPLANRSPQRTAVLTE